MLHKGARWVEIDNSGGNSGNERRAVLHKGARWVEIDNSGGNSGKESRGELCQRWEKDIMYVLGTSVE